MFTADCPRLLDDIRERPFASETRGQLERAAHAIKGAVCNFTTGSAYGASLRLEKMGRSGDLTHAEEACKSLEDDIQHLCTALGSYNETEEAA